jgi:hypothetical protein
VACVIFTRAKTARGTIARKGVLEKEKNELRGMPSPALAFMQWLVEDRQNRINRSKHSALVLLTADHNEIDKLTREFERPARLRSERICSRDFYRRPPFPALECGKE